MVKHEVYMKRALDLAKNGWGKTNPNPLVGAVIVKDHKIVVEGYHAALGLAHAEVAAINKAKQEISGGTIYVNLEPCSHVGRNPPCTKAIIESGIKKVVIAMEDPNPKVSGSGIKKLREAGLEVVVGVLEEEARNLNEIFIKYITQKRPFVTLKAAISLDGKIASFKGDSKWISGESSRKQVHIERDRAASIMVGINTIINDNPLLTTRLNEGAGKDPIRIVVDSKGRIPLESKVITIPSKAPLILATTSQIKAEKEKALLSKGVHLIKADGGNQQVDLEKLLYELYQLEIDSILLEGGGELNASALQVGIVDKIMVFIAPKIIGGRDAKTLVEGEGIPVMKDAIKLKKVNFRKIGEDILVEGYLR